MKNRIISLLAAVLLGCGLLLPTACKDEARQLEAAIEAINRQFPQRIAEGATIDGFFLDDKGKHPMVEIRVSMDEQRMTDAIDTLQVAKMKQDFVHSFTMAARQDENLRAMFSLIATNGRTLALVLQQQPSGRRKQVEISAKELQEIVSSKDIPLAELQKQELQRYIISEREQLPMQQGPLTCVSIAQAADKDGFAVVWTYDVDESAIDIDRLNANKKTIADVALATTVEQPNGKEMLRTFIACGCAMRYVYIGKTSGKKCTVTATVDDLQRTLREASSTRIGYDRAVKERPIPPR